MRLVLDTNVVLDLLVFRDRGAALLRAAIEARRVTLHTNAECLAELLRVLDYPEFRLDAAGQSRAFDWYVQRAQSADAAEPPASAMPPSLPRCRDPDDQKFLALAWSAQAAHLVTKDKALLELAPGIAHLGRFAVTEPHALTERLDST